MVTKHCGKNQSRRLVWLEYSYLAWNKILYICQKQNFVSLRTVSVYGTSKPNLDTLTSFIVLSTENQSFMVVQVPD